MAAKFAAILGLIVFALLSAANPVRAQGWQPACAGPPACSPQGDPMGAALVSLHHNYDPFVVPTGSASFMTGTGGRLTAGFAFGIWNGSIHVDGEATPNCTGSQFMTITGCTNGPAGPQGSPKVCIGDPINVATGNHYEDATDFTTTGQAQLSLIRSYNSDLSYINSAPAAYSSAITPYMSRFGYAWRSQYDRYIMDPSGLSTSSTQIDAVRADGNPVHFVLSSGSWYVAYWNPSTGSYSASTDPRHSIDLRLTTDGTYWYIQDSDDTIDKYDMTGKLVRVTYRGGYYQTFTYDGNGNNTVITDSFGRTLTFTYLANGLVDTMTDPSTGVTHYTYVDRSGIGVTPPSGSVGLWALSTVQYPDSTTLTYLYEDNTNWINRFALTGITDENSNRYATWTYDSTTGRALSSQHAGGADLTTVSYDDVHNTRTVTNALGKQSVYNFTVYQGENQLQSIDGVASTHCPAATVSSCCFGTR